MASDSTYRFYQSDFGAVDTKTPHAPVINTTRVVRRGGLRGGSVPPIHLGLRAPRAASVPPPRRFSRPTPVIHTVATASHGASSIGRLSLAMPSASGSSVTSLPFVSFSGYQPRPVARRASIAAPGGSTISFWRVGSLTPATSSSSLRGLSEVTKGAAARPVYRPSSQAGFGRSSAGVKAGLPQVGLTRSAGVGSSSAVGVPKPRQYYRRASISSFGGAGWGRDLLLGVGPSPPPPVKTLQRSSYVGKGSTGKISNKPSADRVLSASWINVKAGDVKSLGVAPVKTVDNDVHPKKKLDFERQMDDLLPVHEDTLAKLRARALLAKDHLSRHKILLDRYLPVQLGPDTDVRNEVESRYSELLSRMPQLDKSRRSRKDEVDRPTIIPPYKPASTTSKGPKLSYDIANISVSSSFTPKVSDTRKRARSVLCKVKGDPHYFDF